MRYTLLLYSLCIQDQDQNKILSITMYLCPLIVSIEGKEFEWVSLQISMIIKQVISIVNPTP